MKSLPSFLLLLISCNPPSASSSMTTTAVAIEPTLRWASTGGGWRAQFACVGFANLFGPNHLDILTKFSAISTTSGASWFSTQLFYSQKFYDAVVHAKDSQDLSQFVVDWMNSYNQMLVNAIEEGSQNAICQNLVYLGSNGEEKELIRDLCSTLVHFDGDWARFVDEMMIAASADYGDPEFPKMMAGADERLEELMGTDLLIQSALAPNSLLRSNDEGGGDAVVYVGPSATESYAVPISAAYIVNASGTAYRYEHSRRGDMPVRTSPTSSRHSFSDWEGFYLYPGTNGTDVINANDNEHVIFPSPLLGKGAPSSSNVARKTESTSDKTFAPAFGGGDSTVIQVAAISSAAMGTKSPAVPSVFTQDLSRKRHAIKQAEGDKMIAAKIKAFDAQVAAAYSQAILDKFAVCTQWPEPCGAEDGMFVDGWISDNPAFAINIGQYHISGGDLSKTLKVILTNTNEEWPTDPDHFQFTQILQYFESPLNKGVDPGSFNWPPGMFVPYQSPQIFSDSLDAPGLDDLIEPIAGSNMTTALLKGTTTGNHVYGIQAGQPVEILVINVNAPITTYIATPALVEAHTPPLAKMTADIADSEELAHRIKAFVEPLISNADGAGGDKDGGKQSHLPHSAGQSVLQGWHFRTVATLSGISFLANLVM